MTIRDGVSNVFKNVQIISSVDKDRVFDLVSKFGDNMKSILIYDRVAQVGLISTFLTLIDFLNHSIHKGTELGNRHGILQKSRYLGIPKRKKMNKYGFFDIIINISQSKIKN